MPDRGSERAMPKNQAPRGYGRRSGQSAGATAASPRLKIGVILSPRFTLTAFAGFVDALRLAADQTDWSRPIDCSWAVLGDEAVPIAASCGALLHPWAPMEDPRAYNYIAVVGGLLHGGQKVSPGTYSFLRKAARARVPLIGLCTGSFILARAGLLDGYEACVHWVVRDEFAAEFPTLRFQTHRMFVVDRDRLTCAGGTSVVHLAAHLIEKHCSRAQALKCLRHLIEEAPLPSNAWQPEEIITKQAQDSLVRQAMLLIEQDLTNSEHLGGLPRLLGISMRQLERRFIADVGIAPRDYRQRLRLSRAKWMIEHTDRSVTEIALDCGFSDCSHFSRVFKSQFETQPSHARREARSAGASQA
jgi:transcriptional regulator GlxA family with amidase domain